MVGSSSLGHPLVGIRLSRDLSRLEGPPRAGPLRTRPRVKLIGNMHGNEPVGRELLLYFARYLLESDARRSDPRASAMLDNVDLHILPTMNPDGFARGEEGKCSGGSYRAGRLNEGRRDLNRDFPDFYEWTLLREEPNYTEKDLYDRRQTETKHLMNWILRGNFVLSANFHDGAVLVNYPWDNYHDRERGSGVFRTPDHEEFYMLATGYSLSHATMPNTSAACEQWGHFQDGVTNGADWYPVFGGMQDFNYLFAGTMEVTVEISCCKFPHSRRLLREWEYNKDSLFNFVEQAQKGIMGEVREEAGNRPVPGARIRVRRVGRHQSPSERDWRDSSVTTDESGVFWRILVPGVYDVQAFVTKADPQTKERKTTSTSEVRRVVVQDEKRHRIVNFTLKKYRNKDDDGDDADPATVRSPPAPPSPRPATPPTSEEDAVDSSQIVQTAQPARLRSSKTLSPSDQRLVFQ